MANEEGEEVANDEQEEDKGEDDGAVEVCIYFSAYIVKKLHSEFNVVTITQH